MHFTRIDRPFLKKAFSHARSQHRRRRCPRPSHVLESVTDLSQGYGLDLARLSSRGVLSDTHLNRTICINSEMLIGA